MKSLKEKRKVECLNPKIELDGNYDCVLYPCEKCKYKQFFFYKENDVDLAIAELLNFEPSFIQVECELKDKPFFTLEQVEDMIRKSTNVINIAWQTKIRGLFGCEKLTDVKQGLLLPEIAELKGGKSSGLHQQDNPRNTTNPVASSVGSQTIKLE